jgi:RimJ/RimL family protein N-acetyltransferase
MTSNNSISGDKVALRPREDRDAADEVRWASDPKIAALDPVVGISLNFILFSIDTLSGTHIGSCLLYGIDILSSSAKLGIRIGEVDCFNLGYGTEAVKLLVNYGFYVLGLKTINLTVLPNNARAIRCYQKCGFSKAGQVVEDDILFDNMVLSRE